MFFWLPAEGRSYLKCEKGGDSPHMIYTQYRRWASDTQHMNQAVHTFKVWAPLNS